MKLIYPILLFVLFMTIRYETSYAQCQTSNAAPINTGYNFNTSAVYTPGLIDSNWKVTAYTTPAITITNAIALNVGSYVIPRYSAWAVPYTNSQWISCVPITGFSTDTSSGLYYITFQRTINVCGADTFLYNLQILVDNYLISVKIDNTVLISGSSTTQIGGFTSATVTSLTGSKYLSSGPHTLEIVVNNLATGFNYPNNSNFFGLDVAGTFTSQTSAGTIVKPGNTQCYCLPIVGFTAGNNGPACAGQTVQLSATTVAGATYSWVGPNGFTSNLQNPVINNFSAAAAGTYTVTVTNNAASVSASTAVSLTATAGNSIVASPHDTAVCPGQTVALSVTGGTNYNWTPTSGLSSSTSSNPTASVTTPVTYVVSGKNALGCTVTDTVKIRIGGGPGIVAHPRDTTVCPSQTVSLSVTGGSGYSWTPASGLSSSTSSNPTALIAGPVTYIVSGKDALGCTATDTVKIKIGGGPGIVASPHDTSLCINQTLRLSVSGGSNYHWTPSAGLSSSTSSNPTTVVTAPITYIVNGTDALGCSATDSVNVKIGTGPGIVAIPHDTAICANQSIQLWVNGGSNYQWTPSSGLSQANIANPVAAITNSITYVVTGLDAKGCHASDSVHVTLAPNVPLFATADNSGISCYQSSVTLHVKGGNLNYKWSPGIYCNDSTQPSPIVTPPVTTLFTVTGPTANGCLGIDTITVVVYTNDAIYMPNAFTPNNDGRNDNIKPTLYCNLHFELFQIFNRWGQSLFSTTDPAKAWDGTYNGVPSENGVYIYLVRGKKDTGEEVIGKGNITLLR